METNTKSIDASYTNGESITIDLRPGMAWALYSDSGPGGVCGQSSDITCPHSFLAIWPNEDAMKESIKSGIGRNKRARVLYGVVDEYTSGGVFRVIVHESANDKAGVEMKKQEQTI